MYMCFLYGFIYQRRSRVISFFSSVVFFCAVIFNDLFFMPLDHSLIMPGE